MANSSAQIEKARRGFTSPMINTPPEIRGQLDYDIALQRSRIAAETARLNELLDVKKEVENSLWSDLAGVYRTGATDFITSKESPSGLDTPAVA